MKTVLASAVLCTLLTVAPSSVAVSATPPASTAQQGAASRVVVDSAGRVLATLDSRRAEFKANPAALNQFIKTEFTRSFDSDYAARLVLGVHGRNAAPADVADFAAAMADNLTARYGASLLDFNTKLQVKVKSETPLPGNRGVRVSTQMLRQGGAPIPVDYLLRNVNGQWKLFDVMVEGISYVQAFKNQFAAPLTQKSIRQVAADLRAGRMQAAPAPGKKAR
ncbi:MlaC/ttg2D family ABC transporter substrate-binding protein [Thermomonas carbonis]|uniref:ABC transporter substrate-binding protein n=1 Tax=Thermomonas carbonis TaxID=1463158 RepID=A0A7G9ST37_9GAMM|nr:ABC transporter substrate-binding protein [Thermomonas carbonis]QNN71012.1 ABC transporter substrate-binding protein [Thermomonas carbonis]